MPLFWERFDREAILARIPDRLSSDVYAVYTNFENPGENNLGIYSLIIGALVDPTSLADGSLTAVSVHPSNRAVFPVTDGHPELVGEKWIEIWHRNDLKMRYCADYEVYKKTGEIAIYVGVE